MITFDLPGLALLFALLATLPCQCASAAQPAAPPRQNTAEPSTTDDSRVPSARRAPKTFMGRTIAPTMHFSGAGWLVRAERDAEEHPAKLLAALELEKGQTVCDFGCGNGFYTLELAKRVGPQGIVYAVDIQQEMLDLLADRADPRGLNNIKPVLATSQDTGLPGGAFDLVLMVDAYHELSDPPPVLDAVRKSLKPSGRLAVVEFREEDPEVPILPLHKMSQAQVVREVRTGQLKLVGQFDDLPWQHVLFFARGDSPRAVHELQPWVATQ